MAAIIEKAKGTKSKTKTKTQTKTKTTTTTTTSNINRQVIVAIRPLRWLWRACLAVQVSCKFMQVGCEV